MNFTRIILVLTISYLLFLVFSSNANARESLADVTIQIMDINDNVDDFINRIELPVLAPVKMKDKTASTGDIDRQHEQPHLHTDSPGDQEPHEHPREDVLSSDHAHKPDTMHTEPHDHIEDIKAELHDVKHEEALEQQAHDREATMESSAEILEQMKDSRSHAEDMREEASKDISEMRDEAKEHANPRND